MRNAFRWKESIGPWEERPGHFGDVWMYWTDDGLGYFEFLQVGILICHAGAGLCQLWPVQFFETGLANPVTSEDITYVHSFLQLSEDLGARPIWVFNNGTFMCWHFPVHPV